MVGVFHARYVEAEVEGVSQSGTVKPADVEGLPGERFIVYSHAEGAAQALGRDETRAVSLPPLGYDVFTIVPIEGGVAPIGLADMFNSAGAITIQGFRGADEYEMTVRGEGRFLVWTERAPSSVEIDGQPLEFVYDAGTSLATLTLPNTVSSRLTLSFS